MGQNQLGWENPDFSGLVITQLRTKCNAIGSIDIAFSLTSLKMLDMSECELDSVWLGPPLISGGTNRGSAQKLEMHHVSVMSLNHCMRLCMLMCVNAVVYMRAPLWV